MLTAAQYKRLKHTAADLYKECPSVYGPYYHSENCPYLLNGQCPKLLYLEILDFLQNLPEKLC